MHSASVDDEQFGSVIVVVVGHDLNFTTLDQIYSTRDCVTTKSMLAAWLTIPRDKRRVWIGVAGVIAVGTVVKVSAQWSRVQQRSDRKRADKTGTPSCNVQNSLFSVSFKSRFNLMILQYRIYYGMISYYLSLSFTRLDRWERLSTSNFPDSTLHHQDCPQCRRLPC